MAALKTPVASRKGGESRPSVVDTQRGPLLLEGGARGGREKQCLTYLFDRLLPFLFRYLHRRYAPLIAPSSRFAPNPSRKGRGETHTQFVGMGFIAHQQGT